MSEFSLLRFLFSSAIVIGGLLLVYYLVVRLGVAAPYRKGGQFIEMLDYKPIDRDRGFFLVRVRGEEFFLAYDRNGIYLLKGWKKNEEAATHNSSAGDCS